MRMSHAALASAITAAISMANAFDRLQTMRNLNNAYRSRGHGLGKVTYAKGRGTKSSGRLYPPNGAREVARRQRQILSGMLKPF